MAGSASAKSYVGRPNLRKVDALRLSNQILRDSDAYTHQTAWKAAHHAKDGLIAPLGFPLRMVGPRGGANRRPSEA